MIIRRHLLALPLVIVGWIGILAGVTYLGGDAPAVLVLLPSAAPLAHLPATAAITSVGPFGVTLRGDAGLVADLYRAETVLVLPAELCPKVDGAVKGGCPGVCSACLCLWLSRDFHLVHLAAPDDRARGPVYA